MSRTARSESTLNSAELPAPVAAAWAICQHGRVTASASVTTEFVGVSEEPGRGISSTGPYEFFTDKGEHVYLHDMDFLGVAWRPVGTMQFYFRYAEDWTPAEVRESPVVELTFHGVDVRHWATDLGEVSTSEALGQVSGFGWDGRDSFHLQTWTLSLAFASPRMEARFIAAAPDLIDREGSES